MDELNEVLFNEYSALVVALSIEFSLDIDTLSQEKQIFNLNRTYNPPKQRKRYLSNIVDKPIDKKDRNKGKDLYYLKRSNELNEMLEQTKIENDIREYTLSNGLWIRFTLFNVFNLRYKLHKEIPNNKQKWISQ